MNEPKRLRMPVTKGLRIEAPGCVVYIDRDGDHGCIVDVVPDGARFADSPTMVAAASELDGGNRRYVTREHVLTIRTVVGPEGFTGQQRNESAGTAR